MDKDDSMREAVAREMVKEDLEIVRKKSKRWLSNAELDVYVQEYARNEFQDGLNWYRVQTQPKLPANLRSLQAKRLRFRACLSAGGRTGAHSRRQASWRI
jgi:hypothetical protein